MSDSYLSQVERGLYQPSPDVLKAMGRALGIPPAVLYERMGWLDEGGLAEAREDAAASKPPSSGTTGSTRSRRLPCAPCTWADGAHRLTYQAVAWSTERVARPDPTEDQMSRYAELTDAAATRALETLKPVEDVTVKVAGAVEGLVRTLPTLPWPEALPRPAEVVEVQLSSPGER